MMSWSAVRSLALLLPRMGDSSKAHMVSSTPHILRKVFYVLPYGIAVSFVGSG